MEVVHRQDLRQFFVEEDGLVAYVSYKIHAGNLDIKHTVVPKELGGRGIASMLVQTAFDYAREQGLKPMATCPYARGWLEKHPEYRP